MTLSTCRFVRHGAMAFVALLAFQAVIDTPRVEAQFGPSVPGVPGVGGGRSGSRRSMRRGSTMSAAQKQQIVSQLQQQLKTARDTLQQAEAEMSNLQGLLQSAQSRQDSTRDAVSSARSEAAAAVQKLHDVEAGILDAQPANSPYGMKLAEHKAVMTELDELRHEILTLPAHPEDGSSLEKVWTQEVLHLTKSQREVLEHDARYKAATNRSTQINAELKKLRTELFEQSAEWRAAQDALKAAASKKQDDASDLREAGGDAARARKQLQTAQSVAGQARAAIVTLEAELKQLGVNPQANN